MAREWIEIRKFSTFWEKKAPTLAVPSFAQWPDEACDLPAISWPSSAPRQLSKSEQCNCSGARHFGRSVLRHCPASRIEKTKANFALGPRLKKHRTPYATH